LRFDYFTKDAIEYLENYKWPGNVRELKNFIERANIFANSKLLDFNFVKNILGSDKAYDLNDLIDSENDLEYIKKEVEKKVIISRLKRYNGNVSQTARSLGIDRTSLYKKAKVLGIQLNESD